MVDPCFQKHRRSCSPRATCQIKNSRPSCKCKEGFQGDGFHCEPRATLPIVDLTREILLPSLEGLPPVDEEIVKEVGETPFVMQTWLPTQTAPPTRKPLFVTGKLSLSSWVTYLEAPVVESSRSPKNITVVTEPPESLSSLCKSPRGGDKTRLIQTCGWYCPRCSVPSGSS